MSDTPETDRMMFRDEDGAEKVHADFTRALERDRNKWRAMAEELAERLEIEAGDHEDGPLGPSRDALAKFNQLKNQ